MAHWRTTPSHGYLYLTGKEQAQMPDYMRMDRYEEDCDWALAYVAIPSIAYQPHIMQQSLNSPEEVLKTAHWTARASYPELYERLTGIDTTDDEVGTIHYLVNDPYGEGKEKSVQWHRDWIDYAFENPSQTIAIWENWVKRVEAKILR